MDVFGATIAIATNRQKKTPAENFEDGPPLTLVVVSGNDSNPVVVHTEFSSASLYYAPHPHL
jgi:hypothetical protein